MSNTVRYRVVPQVVDRREDGEPEILFRHPTEPGTRDNRRIKPSSVLRNANTRQASNTPHKQFTKDEIVKHDGGKSYWLFVDRKVYDVNSIFDGHPGGAATILGHAGKVQRDTADEFASIHDNYAYQKFGDKVSS